MKRTTYIMIGMLVTGVAMVCGLMFYVVDRNVARDRLPGFLSLNSHILFRVVP